MLRNTDASYYCVSLHSKWWSILLLTYSPRITGLMRCSVGNAAFSPLTLYVQHLEMRATECKNAVHEINRRIDWTIKSSCCRRFVPNSTVRLYKDDLDKTVLIFMAPVSYRSNFFCGKNLNSFMNFNFFYSFFFSDIFLHQGRAETSLTWVSSPHRGTV
jgi:hypothetical protein